MGREGCCKRVTLACACSVSAPLGLPLLPAHTTQALRCSARNRVRPGPRLRAHPWTKPLRFGAQVALRGADAVGTAFVPFPGPSSSGVWRARSVRLVAFPAAAAQFSGWTAGAPCEADGDCPAPPEVLAKKPACSLVGKVSPLWGCDCPLPALTALAACHRRGMVCS